MGLERYSIGIEYTSHWPEIDEEHDQERGDWVRWADVYALLARIRAAVAAMDEAWRILAEGEHLVGVCDDDTAELADRQAGDDIDAARAALDALLADGGA
jgi:hypothetical protein